MSKHHTMKDSVGFSTLELITGLALLAVFLAVTLPAHLETYYSVKEDETKSNLHTISMFLARYAVDHDGEYPDYILGGDKVGYNTEHGCRAMTLPGYESIRPPVDALIAGNYIDSYPRNPFLDSGGGLATTIKATGASMKSGDGDVRFGYSGELMGNCLDDPRVLFQGQGQATNYQWTMYPVAMAYLGVLNINSPNSYYCMGGLPQWSRTWPASSDAEGSCIKYYWPGEFFYRAGGDFGSFTIIAESNAEDIWELPYKKIDKFMLGAYGSLRTDGLDVIRLTTIEGLAASTSGGAIGGTINGQYYQDNLNPLREASHPDFDFRVQYSNPEVFGGGSKGLMPQFPYFESESENWIYGAPDGFPDGIILVLTANGTATEF